MVRLMMQMQPLSQEALLMPDSARRKRDGLAYSVLYRRLCVRHRLVLKELIDES